MVSNNMDHIQKLIQDGKVSQAYKALKDQAAIGQLTAELFYFKGLCEYKTGQIQEAASSLLAAKTQAPDNVAILGLLAKTYMAKSNFDEASILLKNALKLNITPAHKQVYLDLANIYHHQGRSYKALITLKDAEADFPDDTNFRYVRGRLAAQSVPLWHIPMLAHNIRNQAYEKAINVKVRPGDIVLDVGTGSGLLAMMAARAGADHVYACESNPLMANVAKNIIKSNGYENRISVIEKHSSHIIIGQDMPVKADVLVTEIFDNAVVGEGVLPALSHAWSHLLKPGARVIPEGATLRAALIESPHFKTYHNIGDICGFDLSLMNDLSHPQSYKDVNFDVTTAEREHILSNPFVVHQWDFTASPQQSFSNKIQTEVTANGTANGLLMWFDLNLTKDAIFTTQSPSPLDHWRQVCQLLNHARHVKTGDNPMLEASYDKYFEFNFIS